MTSLGATKQPEVQHQHTSRMNLNFTVVDNSSNRTSAAPPQKKQCRKLASATEMGDSDVSLSDDDGDELVRLSRSRSTKGSRSDGKVSIPEQSTVFLKIADERVRQNKIAQAALAESGRQHTQIPRASSNGLHSTVPQHAISSIGRINPQQSNTNTILNTSQQQSSTHNTTTPAAIYGNKTTAPINSILGASASLLKKIDGSKGTTKNNKDVRMVGSILLNTSKLIQNSSVNQSSSRLSSMGQEMGQQMISLKTGNAVLDKLHFSGNQNQNQVGKGKENQKGIQSKELQFNEKENIRRDQIAKKKEADLLEIQQLLGKKSAHAEEREVEWFDGFEQRTGKLAEKEESRKKMALVVSTFIKAYHCQECKIITESELAMQLCTNKEHNIIKIKAVKWFFECAICKRRESTLSQAPSTDNTHSHIGKSTGKGDPNDNKIKYNPNKLPDTDIVSGQCSKLHPTKKCQCGGFHWISCSKYGNFDGTSIKNDQKIILSASEWTSRKDLHTLDTIRSSVL